MNPEKNSTKKKIFYTILILLSLFIISEIGLRTIYFQYKAESPLVYVSIYRAVSLKFNNWKKQREFSYVKTPPNSYYQALFSDFGKNLLDKFCKDYEKDFVALKDECDKTSTKLIVLYIPTSYKYFNNRPWYSKLKDRLCFIDPHKFCLDFFSKLCSRYNTEMINISPDFSDYSPEDVYLLPLNGHMSRFGCSIVSDKLYNYISEQYPDYRAVHPDYANVPEIMGELYPVGKTTIAYPESKFPYRLTINSQGFRQDYDLSKTKEKGRILILGDSFTFGAGLHNHETFPAILDNKMGNWTVINGGVAGFTVRDEMVNYIERSKYLEPDIVILQVLDNDLPGYFYKLCGFNKRDIKYYPSEMEANFLDSLRTIENN